MECALKMIKRYFENKDEARLKQYLINCKVPREDLQESIEQSEDFDLLDFFLDCCEGGTQAQATPGPVAQEAAVVDVVERSEAERKEDAKKELEKFEQYKEELWWGNPEYFRNFDLQYFGKFPIIDNQKQMDQLLFDLLKVFRSLRYNGKQFYVVKKMEYDSYGKPLCLSFDIQDQTTFNSNYSKFKYGYYKTVGRDAKGKPQSFQFPMMDILLENPWFRIEGTNFIPYAPGEKDPLFGTPILNLFTGYQAKLLEKYDMKKVQPFLDLIREIWADNDEVSYQFFVLWLACAVQFPRLKTLCLVLIGSEGSGKTVLINFIMKLIFGKKYYSVMNNLNNASSNFNAQLETCLLLYVAEMKAAGRYESKGDTKAMMDNIKTLITDSEIRVEKKYQDAQSVRNYTKSIFSSNHPVPVYIEEGNRRYAVFDVSSSRKDDREYFAPFFDEVNGYGQDHANHLLSYLMSLKVDMDLFSKERIPKTEALERCIKMSSGADKLFLSEFMSGEFVARVCKSNIPIPKKASPNTNKQSSIALAKIPIPISGFDSFSGGESEISPTLHYISPQREEFYLLEKNLFYSLFADWFKNKGESFDIKQINFHGNMTSLIGSPIRPHGEKYYYKFKPSQIKEKVEAYHQKRKDSGFEVEDFGVWANEPDTSTPLVNSAPSTPK